MNASDRTIARQNTTLQCSLPLVSTLTSTLRTISSISGGSTRTEMQYRSTIQVPCGTFLSYETLDAMPSCPALAPFATQPTTLSAYREIYSTMTSPSTVSQATTTVQLAPLAMPICP